MKMFLGVFFAVALIFGLCAALIIRQEGFSWWLVSAVVLGSAVIAGLETYFHYADLKRIHYGA